VEAAPLSAVATRWIQAYRPTSDRLLQAKDYVTSDEPHPKRLGIDGCIQVHLNAYGGGMETFQIAELARRTGFTRPTLRYYEEIGLLEEPERSESGYRVYDRDDEARLQFIRRAKRLGLSLDDIRDLVGVWTGGECATTRRQLRELVEHKITAVREQVEESATFLRQLEAVSDRLTEEPEVTDGCRCAPELPHVNVVQLGRDLDRTIEERRDHREHQRA